MLLPGWVNQKKRNSAFDGAVKCRVSPPSPQRKGCRNQFFRLKKRIRKMVYGSVFCRERPKKETRKILRGYGTFSAAPRQRERGGRGGRGVQFTQSPEKRPQRERKKEMKSGKKETGSTQKQSWAKFFMDLNIFINRAEKKN